MKVFHFIIITTVFLFVFSGCAKVHQQQITIDKFNLLNPDSILIVDVRTSNEFNAGHIPNAINFDWYDDEFLTNMKQLNQKNEIYLYCQTDSRSNEAAIFLSKNGFKKVINITGGYQTYIRSKKHLNNP